MEEEGFQEDLVSLYNLDDWDDSSSFDDCDYSPPQQVLLNETSNVGFAMASIIVSRRYGIVFFNERESVRLVLHPRKPDDQNPAIKVLNAEILKWVTLTGQFLLFYLLLLMIKRLMLKV